ncbi:hypothetical protein ACXZ7B_05115 [Vibrio owensii]
MVFDLNKFLMYSGVFVSVTFLNKLAIIILPIITIFLCDIKTIKNDIKIFALISLISFPFWFYTQPLLLNWILGGVLLLTFFVTFTGSLKVHRVLVVSSIKLFTILMVFNSVLGTFQYMLNANDDAFIGFFGRSGLQSHGLGFIYVILCIFYFFEHSIYGVKISKYISVLFLYSFLMCFFGTALICLISTLIIYSVIRLRFYYLVGFIITISLLFNSIYFISPDTYSYNLNNISLMFYGLYDIFSTGYYFDDTPRKLVFLYNYYTIALNDIYFFIFGSGPGTFNSRVSFLLSGDYSKFEFLPILKHQYAESFIFPLWNYEVLINPNFEGTRNQPFSSLFAIISEYGIVFSLLFLVSLIRRLKTNNSFVFLVSLFTLIMSLFVNIAEYPELTFIIMLLFNYLNMKEKNNDISFTPTWKPY